MIAILLMVGFATYVFWRWSLSPEESLLKFYAAQGAEDQLMDPLIVGGAKVVPLILKDINDKNMPLRRYAIGALGNIGDASAIATLESLLKDQSEVDYIQCDALEAIALINPDRGRVIATAYSRSSTSCLHELSAYLLSGKLPHRRTYIEALGGWHE